MKIRYDHDPFGYFTQSKPASVSHHPTGYVTKGEQSKED